MQLRVTVDASGNATTITLVGELDVATTGQLVAAAGDACDRGHTVVCDMGGLRFADSTGLGALVQMKKRCDACGGKFVLMDVSERIEHTLSITGLDVFLRN